MKILKTISKWRKPDNLFTHSLPTISSTSILFTQAIHERDQSTESSQYTSTRAFSESLTKPTHEDTVLLPTRTHQRRAHISTPDIPATLSPPPRPRRSRRLSSEKVSRRSQQLPFCKENGPRDLSKPRISLRVKLPRNNRIQLHAFLLPSQGQQQALRPCCEARLYVRSELRDSCKSDSPERLRPELVTVG